ncbi:MAG: 2-hydroxychromene-2-carboxylate isomerase [Pseudomonadota bacterium]
MKAVQFYFDFTSPYSYIASRRIDEIAQRHGRAVEWHPILLGAVFKITGMKPLLDMPMMGDYTRNDIARSAREHHIPLRMPSEFPVSTVTAARAVCWAKENAPDAVNALVHGLFTAYFEQDKNISALEAVREVAHSAGIDPESVSNGVQDPQIKAALKDAVDHAIALNIFGAPWVIVDGESFWGNDRLHLVDKWLETGGW